MAIHRVSSEDTLCELYDPPWVDGVLDLGLNLVTVHFPGGGEGAEQTHLLKLQLVSQLYEVVG